MRANEEMLDHLSDLSDAELMESTKTALDDLTNASRECPNSEWHEACFAGAVIYAAELKKRGLTFATRH